MVQLYPWRMAHRYENEITTHSFNKTDTIFGLNLGVTCFDTIFGINLGVTCSGVHVNAYAIVSPKITRQFIIELTSIPARMLTHVCLRRVYLHNTQLEYPSSVWQNLDSWLTSNATNHVRLSRSRISTDYIKDSIWQK